MTAALDTAWQRNPRSIIRPSGRGYSDAPAADFACHNVKAASLRRVRQIDFAKTRGTKGYINRFAVRPCRVWLAARFATGIDPLD